jgi:hypothetical protein
LSIPLRGSESQRTGHSVASSVHVSETVSFELLGIMCGHQKPVDKPIHGDINSGNDSYHHQEQQPPPPQQQRKIMIAIPEGVSGNSVSNSSDIWNGAGLWLSVIWNGAG